MKTLAEAKPEIEPVVARDKAKAAAETLSHTVEAEARTGGMEKAAKNHGLQVVDIGYFARSEPLPGIGNAPAFMDAAFAAKRWHRQPLWPRRRVSQSCRSRT